MRTRRSPLHPSRPGAVVGVLCSVFALGLTACSTTATPSTLAPSPTPTPTPTPTASELAACPASDGEQVKSAPGQGKTVALTFDDGPSDFTLEVADALAAEGVHATFFVTGEHAAAHPDIVRTLALRGHLVGTHSVEHRYPKQVQGGWTTAYVSGQITDARATVSALTGDPACFFRPPGGFLDHVPAAARATDVAVVMWSVDSLDWKQPASTTRSATAAIVDKATATEGAKHPIVLFHDGKASRESDAKVTPNRSNTVAALPEVIAWYRDHGYTFVRLDGTS